MRSISVVLGVVVLSGFLALRAPAEEGVGEKIGEKIDKGVNKVVTTLQKEWAEVRQSVDNMGVEGRVYGRLHWDKALQSAVIDVEVREGQHVVLKGSVATSEAKLKAVRLARETVGVKDVVDELAITVPKT